MARSSGVTLHDGRRRWNHNLHYHRIILDAVPHDARTALDIGTGDGLLAADLRSIIPTVTGIDRDISVLESARRECPAVEFVHGDVLEHPFEPGSFDLVASVATVHHLPNLERCLDRFGQLAAPGGVVAIVGLARTSRVHDVLLHFAGLAQHRYFSSRYGLWKHTAPTVWPPAHTYAEVRRTAQTVLPGVRWKQLAMWRYALVWRKPGLLHQAQ